MQLKTERELLDQLTAICNANHIEIEINPIKGYDLEGCTLALDVEHDERGAFVGCGLYVPDSGRVYYFSDLRILNSLPFHTFSIIAHNGRSDFECLHQWGIEVQDSQLVWDTELIAHILDSSRRGYGLKKLVKEDLALEYPAYDELVGKRTAKVRRTLDKWSIEIVSKYNALDCYATYKLYQQQKKQIPTVVQGRSATEDYFHNLEKPVSLCFAAMENRGLRVDLQYLNKLKMDLERQKLPLEQEIKNELGPINLNSPKQLLEALHGKGIYPTLKGKASTDKRALAGLPDRIVQHLLGYSELETLLSSFVLPYLERNQEVVHPFFNQCGTRTGRPSCSNPNLLQIPRRTDNGKLVRRMFIPRDGMLMGDCDFGQIEPRVLAHLSKDEAMLKMFNDGTDFHTFTAERLGITRDRAKVLNLSVGYRATFKSVMAQLGGTKDEAQAQINAWWALFPGLRRWQENLIYSSKKSGFCITLLGRRIKVDGLTSYNPWERESAERQLINNITQGSAAEIMKMAMIKIKEYDPRLGLLCQVYDELLFESPNIDMASDIVKECMENAVKLDVPLTVDCKTGTNWAEIH